MENSRSAGSQGHHRIEIYPEPLSIGGFHQTASWLEGLAFQHSTLFCTAPGATAADATRPTSPTRAAVLGKMIVPYI